MQSVYALQHRSILVEAPSSRLVTRLTIVSLGFAGWEYRIEPTWQVRAQLSATRTLPVKTKVVGVSTLVRNVPIANSSA
jgi:hypothetical protein